MLLPHFDVYEGNGDPLLMVHGILSSRAQWLLNLEALRTVATPVVVELFGHGRSESPEDTSCYQPDYYVAAFEAIRESLGVDKWPVLGYSLGAGLTLRYSLTHPDRISAQMFTNSTSAFATEETTSRIRANADAILNQYHQQGQQALDEIPVHPRHAKRLPDQVKTALLEDCRLLDPLGVARTIVYTNGYSSVRNLIRSNTVRTLLICGEHEQRFEPHRNYAEANMPALETVRLSAGHAVNAEAATGFNDAVMTFLTNGL